MTGEIDWKHLEETDYAKLGKKVDFLPNCLRPDLTKDQKNNFNFMKQRYLCDEKEMCRLCNDELTSDDLAREMKISYNFVPTPEVMGMLFKKMT